MTGMQGTSDRRAAVFAANPPGRFQPSTVGTGRAVVDTHGPGNVAVTALGVLDQQPFD
jgi:hypothetical protein